MREALQDMTARIRAHPDFLSAAQRFVDEYLAWRAQLGVLNKLLSNVGREHLFEHLMQLHAMRLLDDRGPTFERLAHLSAKRDRVGARAVRTALRLAHIARLVHSNRSMLDKRLLVYTPTEILLELTRDAYVLALRALDRMLPGQDSAERLEHDQDFLSHTLERMGRAYFDFEPRADRVLTPFDEILRVEGGRPIMSLAVACGWRGDDLPPSQEIARKFYVSASQTRAVLKMAETRGLVRVGARGRLEDAAALTDVYLQAFARLLAHFALCALDLDADSFTPQRA